MKLTRFAPPRLPEISYVSSPRSRKFQTTRPIAKISQISQSPCVWKILTPLLKNLGNSGHVSYHRILLQAPGQRKYLSRWRTEHTQPGDPDWLENSSSRMERPTGVHSGSTSRMTMQYGTKNNIGISDGRRIWVQISAPCIQPLRRPVL